MSSYLLNSSTYEHLITDFQTVHLVNLFEGLPFSLLIPSISNAKLSMRLWGKSLYPLGLFFNLKMEFESDNLNFSCVI